LHDSLFDKELIWMLIAENMINYQSLQEIAGRVTWAMRELKRFNGMVIHMSIKASDGIRHELGIKTKPFT
jgi:hypothetical protein